MKKDIYSISVQMKRKVRHRFFSVASTIFACLVAVTLFFSFVIFPVINKSVSMAPGIPEYTFEFIVPLLKKPSRGDVMLVSPHSQENYSLLKMLAGKFCLFFTAQQWDPFSDTSNEKPCLRRVIGIPGDIVYMDNYILYIKPSGTEQFLTEFELTEKKYVISVSDRSSAIDTELGSSGHFDQITLEENCYFLLGDNRMQSFDSRHWGTVKASSFLGRAIMIYFPISKIRLL